MQYNDIVYQGEKQRILEVLPLLEVVGDEALRAWSDYNWKDFTRWKPTHWAPNPQTYTTANQK